MKEHEELLARHLKSRPEKIYMERREKNAFTVARVITSLTHS